MGLKPLIIKPRRRVLFPYRLLQQQAGRCRGVPLPDDATLGLRRQRSGSIQLLSSVIAVATIVGCGLSLTIALLAVRLDEAGFSARAIGWNTAAGGVATLVGAPFIPWAARKMGIARLLLAALVLGGLTLISFTLTSDYTAWLVLRFAEGLSVTVMFVISEFWITSIAPARWRGMAIAIYVTSLALGFAAGPLVLTMIGTAGNIPFLFGAALFFGAAVPLSNANGAPPIEESSRKTLVSVLWRAPMATLAGLLHGAIEVAGLSLLPVYALRSSLTVADGALFASLFVLGNCMLQLPIGWIADRVDRGTLLIGLAVAGSSGAAFLAFNGVTHRFVFDLVLFFWGGIVGAFYPVGLGQLGGIYRGEDLARANSAYVMTYALGMLIGPPLIGFGLDLLPPSGFFWTVGMLLLCYLSVAVAYSTLKRRARPSFP